MDSILVFLAADFSGEPVEHITLINLGWQHHTGYVSKVFSLSRGATYWEDRHKLLLPCVRPGLGAGYLVEDIGQENGKQGSELVHKRHEDIALHHRFGILEVAGLPGLEGMEQWQVTIKVPRDVRGLERVKICADVVEEICKGLRHLIILLSRENLPNIKGFRLIL